MVQFLLIFGFCLPTLLLASPISEDQRQSLTKSQQTVDQSSDDVGNELNDLWLWHLLKSSKDNFIQLRSLDSLGRGNILRSLSAANFDGDSWLGGNGRGGGGGNGPFAWRRFNGGGGGGGGGDGGDDGGLKRGGLDSLGHGNILKRSSRL